ncbi:MAG: CHASE2 domain-containing protein [Proteobacteria bacterium]|nr:CHASE2 domain-containing protein [Pseudomonadota bacterium]
MQKELSQWLQSPSISTRLVILTSLFWIVLFSAIELSPISFEAETRLVNPLLFRIRELLGQSPALNPHIKTYGIDDQTIGAIQRPQLLLNHWVALLELIDSRQPKAIVIDSLFSLIDSSVEKENSQRQILIDRLKQLKTPVITGSFASHIAIEGRVPTDLSKPAFQLSNYLKSLPNSPMQPEQEAAALPIANFQGSFVYGPQNTLQEAFSRVGNLHYGNREGRFYPFLRLSPDRGLPHIMLRALDDVYFYQGVLRVHGAELPLARDGSALVNFSSYEALRKNVRPLLLLLSKRFSHDELASISPEDYIYIVPMYYTGNVDHKPSPIGLISGAFVHLAVLNSILQQTWLRPIEAGLLFIVGFGVLAALLAWWFNPGRAIPLLLVCLVIWTLICIAGFVGPGWVLPWLSPSLSFATIGLCLVGFRVRASDRKAQYIRQALDGSVLPETLKQLAEHPEKISLDARERVLTVMFIDIVGFSMMVENQLPRTAFECLKNLVDELSSVIHKNGGIVNKTLGDGLLCFFGYSFEHDTESFDHAGQGLKAAIEIQQLNVYRMLKAARNHEPVFPLRIGINTAAVFMGNLGSGNRLDFTVFGNGVNFAKRLEGACLPHSVLIGPTSKELVEPLGALPKGTRRLISIKHYSEMVEAWEYDPFLDKPNLRILAEDAYKNTAYIRRVERRWSLSHPERIKLSTVSGVADLLNFSATGMSFALPNLIPCGTRMTLQIDSQDGILQQHLQAQHLHEVEVEVRWVQKGEEFYLHGVRYLDLDDRQTDFITDLLCQFGVSDYADVGS